MNYGMMPNKSNFLEMAQLNPIHPIGSMQERSDSILVITNLNPMVQELEIFEMAREFGHLYNCRLMKDKKDKMSRCICYIHYVDPKDALRAKNELNGKVHFRRELRVQFQKDIVTTKNKTNLIVRNIPKSIKSKQFIAVCEEFGETLSCFVKTEEQNKVIVSLGYGFVNFTKEEDASKFMENYKEKELEGNKLVIEYFVPSSERVQPECKNLYMNSFPTDWSKEKIEEYVNTEFSKFGEITCKAVMKEERTGKHYAFVAYNESESAAKAIEAMNGLEIENERLLVCKAQTKSQREYAHRKAKLAPPQQTNIYIRWLKSTMTEEILKETFKKYGTVTSVCIKNWTPVVNTESGEVNEQSDESRKLKFGFINFKTSFECENAILGHRDDPSILELVSVEPGAQFIFMAQNKETRQKYLQMKRAHMESNQSMSDFSAHQNQRQFRKQRENNDPRYKHGKSQRPIGDYQTDFKSATPMINNGTKLASQTANKQVDIVSKEEQEFKLFSEELRSNREEFEKRSSGDKKNIIGNIMYKRVKNALKDETLVPKITGMLIDSDVLDFEEILEIIEDNKALEERIKEAIEVINANENEENEGEIEDENEENENSVQDKNVEI
jgi:polyadenylate-binding protein